jgi:hypothetical protein
LNEFSGKKVTPLTPNTMKKLLLSLLILTLIGCKKDEPCNCGTITNDGINGNCYYLEIRNECSGNKKTFCFDYDVWFDGNVGEHFCVTNESEW